MISEYVKAFVLPRSTFVVDLLYLPDILIIMVKSVVNCVFEILPDLEKVDLQSFVVHIPDI